jgi:hypothetical protein
MQSYKMCSVEYYAANRGYRLSAVGRLDGIDHMRAVVGAVEQRLRRHAIVYSQAVGELDAHHQLAVGAPRRWSRRPRAVKAPPFDILALHSDYL